MAIKKSELYSSLWKSCDELRGGMDASQYKDYVLVLLFMKYVSDRYAGNPHSLIEVPAGGSFVDMVALKGDKEIGDKINQIIARLAEANNLTGVIDVADFNDQEKLGKGKEMVDRLSNLISIFNSPGLDFRSNRAQGDDILGDAYEYLMRHFATESGKSKGQFYTPAEVSRIMSQVIGLAGATDSKQSIYDPTCGSGSLLLKAHDEAKSTTGLDLAIYGQEMDNATSALAKMNMILHDCPTAEIWKDNTLSAPHFKDPLGNLKLFDFIVANPPFSTKAWSNGFNPAEDDYNRFGYGIPPDKNGDYAFLLHMLTSLKSTGKAAVILPHGVLFRGGAEGVIRKRILQQGYIQAIIGLPANLFFGTSIPACIIILDKAGSAGRKGLFLIDASKGFIKDGNKNRLREQDIHKIVDACTQQRELPKFSRLVPLAEIEANDFNLNIPRYIDTSEEEDLQDIEAHLHGGIPERDIDALYAYWQVMPNLRSALFEPLRPGYLSLKVVVNEIKPTIFGHAEFDAFRQTVAGLFEAWRAEHRPNLAGIAIGDQPKTLLKELAEDLLHRFEAAPLLDAYDVYQHLQDYWYATLQDDVYQLVIDGWQPLIASGHSQGEPNTDLLPPELIVRRYYAAEAAAISELEAKRDAVSRELEELDEEQGGEDGPLAEGKTDKGKLTAASVKARLKAIKHDLDAYEERHALEQCLALIEREAEASKKVKAAQKALDAKVQGHYAKLSEDELKTLVVDDKWLATLQTDVQTELDRVSQALSGRIRQLAERYATPLPALNAEVEALAVKVNAHLVTMGFAV
ncbi:type I restriction-modification system subunit M [Pseudomonas aeruginosa]|uniref:type I restriction-modification system subunit M n=1 Tax=Pseudomonas TaxID=286 RepID=UPI0007EE6702|nr:MULTISPECIES: type I restriction-modification system subunit M [Pseudomonas]MBX6555604.1 type I restriction-modification system subunit M [Pseudomonas aeruginosa]MBX6587677.1 type I restriction-modification system subunit M [Pseudomonas aeruginosa]MBX6605487.1 type I restriction-modification system subunit M [Pseudomonas aeruginosa]MBX6617909.1 type I restriction-modification system subunit M [Pseudomonas aeruginosa]MBX6881100.1 type I restriction-modification system subunit M [Pseudomonas 